MNVLVAEDNPVFQAMLRRLLGRWDYEVTAVRDGNEAWDLLRGDDPPRLAILDWMMPGIDGVEICRRVRSADRDVYTYIILLTARTEAEDLVEGMDAGADDYLTKPFNAHELRVRLRAGRRILDLQQELLAAQEALQELARRDGLTSLLNRNSIIEALKLELSRSDRQRTPVALLMLDVDHFKKINDSHGHLTGDAALRECARRMQSVVRPYDAVGRYGGEEFLVIMPGGDYGESLAQAERVRLAIANPAWQLQGTAIPLTCSIGCAWTPVGHPAETEALIREADQALYAAKKAGRNRVEAAIQAPAELAG